MLNDIKPPPLDMDRPVRTTALHNGHTNGQPHVHQHGHAEPHIDAKEPGLHHSRFMGEKATSDLLYAMPLEDRGSGFSIGLSISVAVVVLILVVWVMWTVVG